MFGNFPRGAPGAAWPAGAVFAFRITVPTQDDRSCGGSWPPDPGRQDGSTRGSLSDPKGCGWGICARAGSLGYEGHAPAAGAEFPDEWTEINPTIAVQRRGETVYYIFCLLPVFQHAADDVQGLRMFTSQLR